MSAGLGKGSKTHHIVRLRQMLQRWRNKARIFVGRIPADVPAGHMAVFKKLLSQVEDEYIFSNQGPLSIPCDESVLEEVIWFIFRSDSDHSGRFVNIEDFKGYCHLWTESQPLLHGFAEKTI